MGMGTILGFIIQYIAKFPKDPTQISWLKEVTTWYGLVGYGFMDLLKMLVVPLIFVSIIRVIINMKAEENLGKLTTRSILTLLGTTTIAAIVGIDKSYYEAATIDGASKWQQIKNITIPLLVPLMIKQIKSQKAMQDIQPKIKEIQEKYKNKPYISTNFKTIQYHDEQQ